ncbi:MAG: signal peptidase I [Ignavibacteriales bacterium]|nr:signal peptidase I [Ignavibacteriales bacterium]
MKQKILKIIKDVAIIIFLIFFIAKPLIIDAYKVKDINMSNEIIKGDFVFVNKFIHGAKSIQYIPFTNVPLPYFSLPAFTEPDRGDLVVFKYPGDRDKLKPEKEEYLILRVIGLPGDIIEIIDKLVFVNGKKMVIPDGLKYMNNESYKKNIIDKNIFPKGMNWNKDNYGPLVVPSEGTVFEVNATNIEQWQIIINREYDKNVVSVLNKEVFIDGNKTNTYKVKNDYYFLMGDNRDDCKDSRFFGFVKREEIIGQPFLIFWSWDTDIPFSDIFDLIGSIRLGRIIKFID